MASEADNAAGLVFFLFDLLYLDGEDIAAMPLTERKARLAVLLVSVSSPLQYSDHQVGHGPAFFEKACALSIEGTVSKRIDVPYAPGNPRALDQPKILRYYDYFGWSCSHVDLGLPLWVTNGKTRSEHIFSELPQVADIARSAFSTLARPLVLQITAFWVRAIPG